MLMRGASYWNLFLRFLTAGDGTYSVGGVVALGTNTNSLHVPR